MIGGEWRRSSSGTIRSCEKREVEKRTKRDSEQNEVQRDGEAAIERALRAKWERHCSSCDHKTAGGRRH